MARFHYSGTGLDGTKVKGQASADSSAELALSLLSSGITLEESRESLNWWQHLYLKIFRQNEVTRITRQMALLLESKVNILECLELVREGTTDRTIQSILAGLTEMIQSGRAVADSFACYPMLFDSLYTSVLSAGELTGTLDTSFGRIAAYREQQEEVLRKLRSAMIYPLLVCVVAVAVVVVLVFYIVPVFASMYENFGGELPSLTQKVVAASSLLHRTLLWWILLSVMILTIVLSLLVSSRAKTTWHRVLVRVPLVSPLVIKISVMRYCRTLGSLLSSGVDILVASKIAATSAGNSVLEQAFQSVVSQLASGISLGESLQTASFFPKPALRLVAAGEKTGQLGPSLLRAADFCEREASTKIATLVALIEPAIIIALGVLVSFLLVALYLPLFDLMGEVK